MEKAFSASINLRPQRISNLVLRKIVFSFDDKRDNNTLMQTGNANYYSFEKFLGAPKFLLSTGKVRL